jgi:hypothetical protein
MQRHLALAGLVSLVAACATTSVRVQDSPTPTPSMVAGPLAAFGQLAFDPATGEMVFVDPSGGGTWTWDNVHDWRPHGVAGPSTARGKLSSAPFGIAWDMNTSSLIAEIGDSPAGIGASQPAPATWSWRGGVWTKLESTNTPAVMGGAIAAFPPKGQVVMFGGCCAASGRFFAARSGMWSWDGSKWTLLRPAHMPQARWDQSMFYDPALGKVVMYGGASIEPDHDYLKDAWAWDGSDWTPLPGPPIPTSYETGQLTYSPGGNWMLLLGSTMRLFDGIRWLEAGNAPVTCGYCAVGYDSLHDLTVLVANPLGAPSQADQVWVWDGVTWTERS